MGETRPFYRWLAAITAILFAVTAVVFAFGPRHFVGSALFASGAILFGSFAATAEFLTGGKRRIRPVFRWLAASATLFFVAMAVVSWFGVLDHSDVTSFIIFSMTAAFLGRVAATGKLKSGDTLGNELLVAAKKYEAGEITLEEYKSRTKEIMKSA